VGERLFVLHFHMVKVVCCSVLGLLFLRFILDSIAKNSGIYTNSPAPRKQQTK